jgi:hypothetical protein
MPFVVAAAVVAMAPPATSRQTDDSVADGADVANGTPGLRSYEKNNP